MNKLFFIFIYAIFSCCNSEISNNKLFEEKIKSNVEDEIFKMNCSIDILELKINKIESARLDSVYRELCFDRVNKLYKKLKKTNSKDYSSIENDEKFKELLEMKRTADTTLRGRFVWYYIKGVFKNQFAQKTNILAESVLSYFDNNNNLLLNKLNLINNHDR